MKKISHNTILYGLYTLFGIMLLANFIFLKRHVKSEIYELRPALSFISLENYERETVVDETAPIGNIQRFSFRVEPDMVLKDFVFFTLHSKVNIYLNNTLVFSFSENPDCRYGKTPGANWNYVSLYTEDIGKTLTVDVIPVYEDLASSHVKFYSGSRLSIFEAELKNNLLPILLSLIALVVGMIFIFFTIINRYRTYIGTSLLWLGVFSALIGCWKFTDMDVSALLFPTSTARTYTSYYTLMLCVLPFMFFLKDMFTDKKNILWYIPCYISILSTFIMLILQVLRISDIRENLWMVHISMFSVIPSIAIMIFRQARSSGWSSRFTGVVLGIMMCFVGMGLDTLVYYHYSGKITSIFSILGFLIFVLIFGIQSYKEALSLIEKGTYAKKYEELAYHDQLTNLYNRTAYAEITQKEGFIPEECSVVMFDINNLKDCNDNLGHEKGDELILNSSVLINNTFGQYGKAYRIGGDEFCVLLEHISDEKCLELINKLKADVDKFNNIHPDSFPIHIASGYAGFDAEEDYDISDTLRRADRMMYINKQQIKANQS